MLISTLSLSLVFLPFALSKSIHVDVGKGGEFLFVPEATFADAGDEVIFHFYPKNHTVTQSSLAGPCTPREGGIDSGFIPVAADSTSPPTYTVRVTDKEPIWIHCKQAAGTANSHCGRGMVFAINCGVDGAPNSFANFKAAAQATLNGGAPPPSPTYGPSYGGYTIPPAPPAAVYTQSITLDSSSWGTTYTSYAGSPDPTPAALAGVTHKVLVGAGGLVFNPNRVDAKVRDTIVFEFQAKNHTVTQSSFGAPCDPLPNGVDSGFVPAAAGVSPLPTFNFTVKDTTPVWFYCRQSGHCAAGMVFAVNSIESSEQTVAKFQEAAKRFNASAALATSPASPTPTGAGIRVAPLHIGGALSLALAGVIAALF